MSDVLQQIDAIGEISARLHSLAREADPADLEEALARRQALLESLAASLPKPSAADVAPALARRLAEIDVLDRETLDVMKARKNLLADEIEKVRKGRRLVRSRYS